VPRAQTADLEYKSPHALPLERKGKGRAVVIPENSNALLTRSKLADALSEAGFPVREATLATMATRGGGPPYRRFGSRVLYCWADALLWALARLSAPRRSTSEADVSTVTRQACLRRKLVAGGKTS
jgi:hypothetical protein